MQSGVCVLSNCNAGYTYSGSSCVQCADGKYKATMGIQACTACPSTYGYGSTSPAGSTSFSACVCTHGAPGYGEFFIMDTTTSKCLCKCESGEYGTADDCVNCDWGKYSDVESATSSSVCLSCPTNTISEPGSDSVDDCQCIIGYYLYNGLCTPCPAGTFKNVIGNYPGGCFACANAQYSSSPGSTTCTLCPPGTYKEFPGVNPACDNCGVGKYTPYEGQSVCQSCEPGKYKATSGVNTACDVCVEFSTSGYSSTVCTCISGYQMQSGECVISNCNAGYTKSGSSCVACAAGTYKNITGFQACTTCPANTYSAITGASTCTNCHK
jgi:hypothetical protein